MFTDVTEREQVAQQRRDSTLLISAIFVTVCLTVLAYKCIYSFFGIALSPTSFTMVVEGICIVAALASFPFTSLTIDDMGLKVVSVKEAVMPGAVIALAGLAVLAALKRVFYGEHSATLSIFISSLIFSVLHIGYELPLMLASMVMLGSLGFFYEKTGNIWSLCIVHYVLGTAVYLMRFA